jgi:galactoside 2-L-fucosyltransferase 1/2
MQYFSQKYENTIFIVVSDDKQYCEKKFGEKKNVIVSPRHFSASEDLAILSFCQHSIVTAGSFGWWSAFLADGDVLHDNRYMQKKSGICDCDPFMYFPPWFLFP